MVSIGRFNQLRIVKQVGFGMYLDGGSYGEILLPRRYVPEGYSEGDILSVFIYLDSEDRLIATTEVPKVQVGECAFLEVVDVSPVGAFLDWGLPKDLLVPFSEQETRMVAGHAYVVYVHLDERTESIIATSRLAKYLSESGYYFSAGQAVDLLVYGQSELGHKAVINHTHLGQLYANEIFQPLSVGQQVSGFIKQVRPDKKIDLSLQQPGKSRQVAEELTVRITDYLQARGGESDLTDKSPPELIYQEFQVSKAQFKRALGQLYKQRIVALEPGKTRLLSNDV